jgi:hypothetical protein
VFSRYAARRDMLAQRLAEARDRLLAVQRALSVAQERAYEVSAVAGEVASLEAAVSRAAERIGSLRDALAADEASLAARLMSHAARLKLLRADADASSAALRAAELEAAAAAAMAASAASASAGGSSGGGGVGALDVPQLARQLEIAKAEQIGALRAAGEEHAALVAASVGERGARLAEAAGRAESQVSYLLSEERQLKAAAAELGAGVAAKRQEAEASLARRRALVAEVEQLKAALAASEASDMQRLAALQGEVSSLEAQVTALRGSAVAAATGGLSPSSPGGGGGGGAAPAAAAVAAAEAEAREAERGRWAGLLEGERAAADRRIAEVRAAGRAQYAELVAAVEGRYVAEFEAALQGIASRQQLDGAEVRALEGRLGEVRRAVEAAQGERGRLEAEARAAHLRAAEELAGQRAKLASLRQAVRAAWRERGADPAAIAGFLHRVQGVLPFSPGVQSLYRSKAEQLRAAAPILRAITRREVLLWRLDLLPRSIADAMRGLAGGTSSASGGSNAALQEQLQRLRGEYSAASEELGRVTEQLLRDIRAFERSRGEAFVYRGVRLLPLLEESLGREAVGTAAAAAPVAPAGGAAAAAAWGQEGAGGASPLGGGVGVYSVAGTASPSAFAASGGTVLSSGASQQPYGYGGAASAFLVAAELSAR